MRRLLAPALVLASLAPLSACGPNECQNGQTRPCYTGNASLVDKGTCRQGLNICAGGAWGTECKDEVLPTTEICDTLDNDCDGFADEEVRNGCGGCATLEGEPGTGCTGCGQFQCESTESVRCVPPEHAVNSECEKDGCSGSWKCGADGDIECRALRKNECGACGGPTVTGLGDACVGENGCDGTIGCNALGTGAVCRAPNRNNCGVCGARDVADIDSACNGASGCEGTYVCNDDGTGKTCDAPAKNECGVCEGPALPQRGDACGGTGPCAGTLKCNATGTALSCVLGAAEACTGTDGCPGTLKCDEGGAPTVCDAPVKNACGTCGGPAVTGLGVECTVFEGCAGMTACNSAGTGSICKPTQTCTRLTDHVVISEISGGAPNADASDFVELYNPTAAEVDMGSWQLWYKPASDSTTTAAKLLVALTGSKIGARGYFLAAFSGYAGTPTADVRWTNFNIGAAGGHIFLTNTSTAPKNAASTNVVDLVGYGTAKACEGSTSTCSTGAPAIGTTSIERKAHVASTAASLASGGADALAGNAEDTNHNKNDFVLRTTRDPQSSRSPVEP